ncbi:hypothetical protein SCLCIDRAFT_1217218 [Scleroderma citrinum Foug A]|uniref:Uncharacterized protein n=1 Tax=Scleroderma citrinum Foug A TaxID=1036808 RepID=A0A0C3DUY4_9AGAM|nr:hypothetical protein SCLCIDRAFT_1217218 [Scleroderma citrinum Foug A]
MEHAGHGTAHWLRPKQGTYLFISLELGTLISRQSHTDDHLGSQFGREVSPHPLRWPVTMTHDQDPQNPLSSSLDGAGAVGTVYTHPETHTCNFYRPCQFPGNHGGYCGEVISCDNVFAHFCDFHGIVNLTRSAQVVCQWTGCGGTHSRHNIIRHIRTKHFSHPR